MKKISAQLAVTMLGIAISYFGAALAAVANIGQGPVSAFCLTLSRLTGLPFGTALTLFQGVFVVGQIALLRKKFPLTRLLQVVTILFGGLVVNFFVYYVFKDAVISSYWLRLALDVLACAVNAAGVSLTLAAALVGVPLESFVQLLCDRSGKLPLGRARQIIDFVLIALALLLTLIFRLEFTLREGTLVSAVVFGLTLDALKKPRAWLSRKLGNEEPSAQK